MSSSGFNFMQWLAWYGSMMVFAIISLRDVVPEGPRAASLVMFLVLFANSCYVWIRHYNNRRKERLTRAQENVI